MVEYAFTGTVRRPSRSAPIQLARLAVGIEVGAGLAAQRGVPIDMSSAPLRNSDRWAANAEVLTQVFQRINDGCRRIGRRR